MKYPPRMLNEPEKSGVLATVLTVFVYLFAFALLVLLVLNAYFSRNYLITIVDGESMMNTFFDGDCVYTDIHAEAKRGEVVIVDVTKHPIYSPNYDPNRKDNPEKSIIKRLIAIEGDSIKCDESGTVWLKRAGETEYVALDEPYTFGKQREFAEVKVGEGEIFVLGDHRNNSTDSEEVGCLKYSDIIGVVPQWAIDIKWYTTGWENFRDKIAALF